MSYVRSFSQNLLMLEKLYAAITDLPVIIQGALGSALFAGAFCWGQKIFAVVQARLSELSVSRRRIYLVEQQLKYGILIANSVPEKGALVSLLIYRASRSLFKALIWLTAGFIFGAVDRLLGVVGFFGCFYYLLLGLGAVTGPQNSEDNKAKLEEIRAELEKLGKS